AGSCSWTLGKNKKEPVVPSEVPAVNSEPIKSIKRNRLMRESLGDDRGVEYAILVPSALADHSITVFNLAGINVVNLLAAVLLTDPSGRSGVGDSPLLVRTHLANGQCRFILTAPDDIALPAILLCHFVHLLLGGSRMSEQS